MEGAKGKRAKKTCTAKQNNIYPSWSEFASTECSANTQMRERENHVAIHLRSDAAAPGICTHLASPILTQRVCLHQQRACCLRTPVRIIADNNYTRDNDARCSAMHLRSGGLKFILHWAGESERPRANWCIIYEWESSLARASRSESRSSTLWISRIGYQVQRDGRLWGFTAAGRIALEMGWLWPQTQLRAKYKVDYSYGSLTVR